jgi:hypothetical protein
VSIFFVFLYILKKAIAILFMGIMLFNGFGYRLVSNFFDQRAAKQLVNLIEENNYNESFLVTIKTPINLPYYANNPQFERVDGEIVIKGIVYQYVQRRIYNDSLELKVLPNQDRLHIKNAKEDFYKLAQDLSNTSADKKSLPLGKSSAKYISFDYIQQNISWHLAPANSANVTTGYRYATRLISNYLTVQGPPPKMIV